MSAHAAVQWHCQGIHGLQAAGLHGMAGGGWPGGLVYVPAATCSFPKFMQQAATAGAKPTLSNSALEHFQGASKQGIKEHIKVKKKFNTTGMGSVRCTYAYTHTYAHTHTHTHTHTHNQNTHNQNTRNQNTHTCAYARVHARTSAHTHTHMHPSMHTHMHTHAHTHTYTQTHT